MRYEHTMPPRARARRKVVVRRGRGISGAGFFGDLWGKIKSFANEIPKIIQTATPIIGAIRAATGRGLRRPRRTVGRGFPPTWSRMPLTGGRKKTTVRRRTVQKKSSGRGLYLSGTR